MKKPFKNKRTVKNEGDKSAVNFSNAAEPARDKKRDNSLAPPLSPARKAYLKKIKQDGVIIKTARLAVLIVFFGLWEFSARIGAIDAFLFSCPTKIALTIASLYKNGNLLTHVAVTLGETLAGFAIATVLGTAAAVALWCFTRLRKIAEPYVIVLNALPKIALGPVIIIAFGSGVKSIIFMTVIVTVIVTAINMLNAFMQTEKGKLLLLKSMGASKAQTLKTLVLPAAAPAFFSTLKVNVGLSWIGSIMGEYLVSRQGLGYLIVYGGQVLQLDLVMTSTVILSVLAALMYAAVALLEKTLSLK